MSTEEYCEYEVGTVSTEEHYDYWGSIMSMEGAL